MNSLKKTYAFLLTTAMSVGLGVSSHYLAMDEEKMPDNSNQAPVDAWDNETEEMVNFFSEKLKRIRDIIGRDLIKNNEYAKEKLYYLPLNEEFSKFMIVNEDLTKCITIPFSYDDKLSLRDMPIGYGNETCDRKRREIRQAKYCEFTEFASDVNVFDTKFFDILLFCLPRATTAMVSKAEKTGIAGYRRFFPIF